MSINTFLLVFLVIGAYTNLYLTIKNRRNETLTTPTTSRKSLYLLLLRQIMLLILKSTNQIILIFKESSPSSLFYAIKKRFINNIEPLFGLNLHKVQ